MKFRDIWGDNIDGVLLTNPVSVRWLTGFEGSFGWVAWTPQRQTLITDSRYRAAAEQIAKQNKGDFWEYDATFREKYGQKLTGKWYREASLDLATVQKLKKVFSKINWQTDYQNRLEQSRRRKTPKEIDLIRQAQNQTNQALKEIPKQFRENITEAQLAWELEKMLRDKGRYTLAFDPIVAFGPNTANPHHHPGSRKLKPQDPVLIDCGAAYRGYHSDTTKCWVWGGENREFTNLYNQVLAAQQATLAQVRAGAKVAKLDQFCREKRGDLATDFCHSLGHGVGLDIHEAPAISARSREVLQPNEVITIEPGVYQTQKFGVRIEDLLLVTNTGFEQLSE